MGKHLATSENINKHMRKAQSRNLIFTDFSENVNKHIGKHLASPAYKC